MLKDLYYNSGLQRLDDGSLVFSHIYSNTHTHTHVHCLDERFTAIVREDAAMATGSDGARPH